MKAASKKYKALISSKKVKNRRARLTQQTKLFFSSPKLFFESLKQSKSDPPIQDLATWERHFNKVCNTRLSDALPCHIMRANINNRLRFGPFGTSRYSAALSNLRRLTADSLNDDFTVIEISEVLKELHNNKAADSDGLVA